MNTQVKVHFGGAEIDSRTKLIRGIGLTEFILGIVVMVLAFLYGELALKHASPADVPFWTSLTSPTALKVLHVVWTVYLASFFLVWHGTMCRRLQRPLRPIGFGIATLVSLKLITAAIVLGFARTLMDSINVTVNGSTVNFGDRFGTYADFFICGLAALAFLAACFAAFCASRGTKRALETADHARYTLDSIPLSVFLGIVFFVCLSYSYLADIVNPSLNFAGVHLSTLEQQVTLLAFAGASVVAAWGFYTRRMWGWFAGLLVVISWAVSNYYPPDDMSMLSRPEFDKYRDFIGQLAPALQKYIQFDDLLTGVSLVALIGYLVYVRRNFRNGEPALRLRKQPVPKVPIYADWRRLTTLNKSWLIFGALAALNWLQHDYLFALLFVIILVLTAALMLIGIFAPRCVFQEEGFALPRVSLLATPVFPYASFKSVQLITTTKPPRPMRSIEDGVMNLNVSDLADDQRALLEEEFRKRDIAVTVLASAAAPS